MKQGTSPGHHGAVLHRDTRTVASKAYLHSMVQYGLFAVTVLSLIAVVGWIYYTYHVAHGTETNQQELEDKTGQQISKLRVRVKALETEVEQFKNGSDYVNRTQFESLVNNVTTLTMIVDMLQAQLAEVQMQLIKDGGVVYQQEFQEFAAEVEAQIQELNTTSNNFTGITANNYGSAGGLVTFYPDNNASIVFNFTRQYDGGICSSNNPGPHQFALVPASLASTPTCPSTGKPLIAELSVPVTESEEYPNLVVCPCEDGWYSIDFSFGPFSAQRLHLLDRTLSEEYSTGLQIEIGLVYVGVDGVPSNSTFFDGDWPLPPLYSTTWIPTGGDITAPESTFFTFTGSQSVYLRRELDNGDTAACYRFVAFFQDYINPDIICNPDTNPYGGLFTVGYRIRDVDFLSDSTRPTDSIFSVQQLGWSSSVLPPPPPVF